MSFSEAIQSFSKAPRTGKKRTTALNNQYLDQHDDIVMCNNCFGGYITQGYILPKPISEHTQQLFPKQPKPAHFPYDDDDDDDDDTIEDVWYKKSTVQLDYCCLSAVAYSYVWDNVINQCIKKNNITPCVYRFAYLFMKAMSRSPRIPPGTVLYRGTKVPFLSYVPDMRFMSFTTDISTAQGFTDEGGEIGYYQVTEQDYIHGLWLDSDYGTSTFQEKEVLLGPGVYIEAVERPLVRSRQPVELKLKQMNIDTYFMDHYNPDGDEKFYRAIQTGCVLMTIDDKNHVFIDTATRERLQAGVENKYTPVCSSMTSIDIKKASYLYLGVQENTVVTIDSTNATTKIIPILSENIVTPRCVYRVMALQNNTIAYCTLSGMFCMALKGWMIQVIPLDDIPQDTIILDSNPYLNTLTESHMSK